MKKKKYLPFILLVLAGVVLGLFLGLVVALFNMTPSFKLIEISLGLTLLSLFISIPLHVAIHEAGHGIFGALTGYSFISYRIFDFHFQKEEGRIRRRKVHIPGTLGQCIMEPKGSWDKTRGILYLLGGGFFNLLTALVLFVISLELKEGLGWEFFLGASLMALFLGVSNLWPLRIQGMATDGKNIQYLYKSLDNQRALWMQLKVTAELTKGKGWKDLPERYFFDFQGFYNQSSLLQGAGMMASSFWLNQNQILRSEKILREIGRENNKLAGMGAILYYIARLESLRFKGEWEEYSRLYQEIEEMLRPIEKTEDGIYAKYIYYRYGKEEEEVADGIWQKFLEESKSSPYQGIIKELVKEEEERREELVRGWRDRRDV